MFVGDETLAEPFDILGVLLREGREVVLVLDELLGTCAKLHDIDEVVVDHQVAGSVEAHVEHVALLHVNLSILLIGFWRLWQTTGETHVGVHGRCHQEEDEQNEGDIGCGAGVQPWHLFLLSCHIRVKV